MFGGRPDPVDYDEQVHFFRVFCAFDSRVQNLVLWLLRFSLLSQLLPQIHPHLTHLVFFILRLATCPSQLRQKQLLLPTPALQSTLKVPWLQQFHIISLLLLPHNFLNLL